MRSKFLYINLKSSQAELDANKIQYIDYIFQIDFLQHTFF